MNMYEGVANALRDNPTISALGLVCLKKRDSCVTFTHGQLFLKTPSEVTGFSF